MNGRGLEGWEEERDWIVGGNLRGDDEEGVRRRGMDMLMNEKNIKVGKRKSWFHSRPKLPRSNYQTLQPTKPPPNPPPLRMPPPIFKPTPPQPPPPPPKLPTPTSPSPQPPPSPPHPPPPPPSPLAAATSPSAHSLYTPGS